VFGDILDDCSWISEFQDGVDPCAIADMEPAQFLLDRNQTERYSHDIRKIAENECWIASSRPAVPSLGLGGTTSGWLRASYDATAWIAAGKADLKTPLLIIGGGNDRIVSNAGQEEFCDVDNPFCCRLELEGAGHELLIEDERYRHAFFDAFRSFVTEASPPEAFCASRRQAVR
jgi:alpha-beta hydrolase superfamily lysophospholipase